MRLTRRGLIGAGAAGVAAAAAGGAALGRDTTGHDDTVPFTGAHQAGIVTAQQEHLHFAAFDMAPEARASDLRDLLRTWSAAAARMTAGRPVGSLGGDPLAPPADTGEAAGLPAARLTVTFGLGPALFDRRFGLAARRPAALRPLPALPGDALEPDRSGGDLCVQACADDPQVAFHAVRNLARLGRGIAVLRWSQLGFGRAASTSRRQATPRNLLGFRDGTRNLRAEDTAAIAEHVWASEPAWLRGGTYVVARRIRMLIEVWDRAALDDQEQTIGRRKASGAPFGGHAEFDPIHAARLPPDSHVRLALPETNGGIQILRRGYNFTDGLDERLGQLDAGLFFIAFTRDPAHFVALQRRLGAHDKLNEYIEHVGSGVWAVPPGASAGGWVGETVL
ncbi:MAG TPA: iron uptake transporter deferrochelatase/peroxidase subunit [Solirubrobacteraceae bacterium]